MAMQHWQTIDYFILLDKVPLTSGKCFCLVNSDIWNKYQLHKRLGNKLMVCIWRHGGRVGGPTQRNYYVINSIVGSSRRRWLTLPAPSPEIDCKLRIWRYSKLVMMIVNSIGQIMSILQIWNFKYRYLA